MSFEKLMEIKLILEAEDLEQQYGEWEERLAEIQLQHKSNKGEVEDQLIDAKIEYWWMLKQEGQNMQDSRRLTE